MPLLRKFVRGSLLSTFRDKGGPVTTQRAMGPRQDGAVQPTAHHDPHDVEIDADPISSDEEMSPLQASEGSRQEVVDNNDYEDIDSLVDEVDLTTGTAARKQDVVRGARNSPRQSKAVKDGKAQVVDCTSPTTSRTSAGQKRKRDSFHADAMAMASDEDPDALRMGSWASQKSKPSQTYARASQNIHGPRQGKAPKQRTDKKEAKGTTTTTSNADGPGLRSFSKPNSRGPIFDSKIKLKKFSNISSSSPISSPNPQPEIVSAPSRDSSDLSSPPDSPLRESSYDPCFSKCPFCNCKVSREFLDSFANGQIMKYDRALRFCTAHKARDASEVKSQYPNIDWETLDKRLERFHDHLIAILDKRVSSAYRLELEQLVSEGQSRNAMRNPESNASGKSVRRTGYYGAKGAAAMTAHILDAVGERLRDVAAKDAVFAEVGVSGFVQSVLMPELVLLLIREDFGGCDEARAKEIAAETADIGDELHHEGENDIRREESPPMKSDANKKSEPVPSPPEDEIIDLCTQESVDDVSNAIAEDKLCEMSDEELRDLDSVLRSRTSSKNTDSTKPTASKAPAKRRHQRDIARTRRRN